MTVMITFFRILLGDAVEFLHSIFKKTVVFLFLLGSIFVIQLALTSLFDPQEDPMLHELLAIADKMIVIILLLGFIGWIAVDLYFLIVKKIREHRG